MTPDLRTRYLSLELRHPVVASASPLTGDLDTLKALEEDYQLFLDPHTGRPCRYGWDVPLFWTAVARAKQVRAIGEVLYAYRVHGDNDQVRHREDQIETETRLSREFDRRLMTKMPWWSEKQKKDLDDAKDEGLARGSSKSSDPVA